MFNYKILVWGAKSKTLILLNMIKNNELFYENKKIKEKKICLLVDPFLNALSLLVSLVSRCYIHI